LGFGARVGVAGVRAFVALTAFDLPTFIMPPMPPMPPLMPLTPRESK
jgi:hypothetical protein